MEDQRDRQRDGQPVREEEEPLLDVEDVCARPPVRKITAVAHARRDTQDNNGLSRACRALEFR